MRNSPIIRFYCRILRSPTGQPIEPADQALQVNMYIWKQPTVAEDNVMKDLPKAS